MLVNTLFEGKVERLWDLGKRLGAALAAANIPYRVVGGFAVFVHVEEVDPLKARLTRDIDVAIERAHIQRISDAVASFGLVYRQVAGVDMLVDVAEPKARSAVHLIFVGEKVRPDYIEAVPNFSEPAPSSQGMLLAPVADLVRMKLTSFRLKDKVHIQDMDSVGLITQEIEAGLSEALQTRLAEVRATE